MSKLLNCFCLLLFFVFVSQTTYSSTLTEEDSPPSKTTYHTNKSKRIKKPLDTWESCFFASCVLGGGLAGAVIGGSYLAPYVTDPLLSAASFIFKYGSSSASLSPASYKFIEAISNVAIVTATSFIGALTSLTLGRRTINAKKRFLEQDKEVLEGMIINASREMALLARNPSKVLSKDDYLKHLQTTLNIAERDAEWIYNKIIEGKDDIVIE